MDEQVIPVIAEELEVGKRQVDTGSGVRVHKTVTEREQIVDQPLLMENAEVTRVPVNRIVTAAPAVRYEGDLTVIPVVEEQLVIEKRLVLKEEIHIRKTRQTVRQPQTVTLREEHAQIEHFGESAHDTLPSDETREKPQTGSILDRVYKKGSGERR